jgi:ankyrin repeat protein
MTNKRPKKNPRPGVDEYGRTPLHYAAAAGEEIRVEELLRGAADPNAQDDNGWTALHFAAQATSSSCVRALLEAGARIDLRDSHGNTPLWRAVFDSRGDGTIINLLRGAGADPRAANARGVSPVKLARTIGNYDVAQFFADVTEGDAT